MDDAWPLDECGCHVCEGTRNVNATTNLCAACGGHVIEPARPELRAKAEAHLSACLRRVRERGAVILRENGL